MKRNVMGFVTLIGFALLLSGCVTFRDSQGNAAPQDIAFDCDQKCGMYDSNAGAVMTGICVNRCMNAKGYR